MKFLIADAHPIVREGLKHLLQIEFPTCEIIETGKFSDLVNYANSVGLAAIILDINTPGRNGIETIKQIRSNGNTVPILVLSCFAEELYALRTLKAGANGFINKETTCKELLYGIHKILAKGKYISTFLIEKLADSIDENQKKQSFTLLSDRELQVLQLIGSGKTSGEIAIEMTLSSSTISTYRARILEKLQMSNNAELIRYVMDNNLNE